MKVPFSYLDSKLADSMEVTHPIYQGLKELMQTGDFTLGKAVRTFEEQIEKLTGAKHAIGVANGTDALRISLRLAGVGPGDEVITAANTFIASAGCADELFASPRFVDMSDNYTLDPKLIEQAITPRTKAIVPVHFTGEPCEMDHIMDISTRYGIPVIEDACQALMAEYKGKFVGTIGLAGAISLHPLKVLNGTGDGGLILTNDDKFAEEVRLYRNHGLVGRNNISRFGCNSRLDTVQAVFLNHLVPNVIEWTRARRVNAKYYDMRLQEIPGVFTPKRREHAKSCYHLYMAQVKDAALRDSLVNYLNDYHIEARVHYPLPLQGALELTGHSREDFPKAYDQSDRIFTLPVHEHLTKEQLDFVCDKIEEFMLKA